MALLALRGIVGGRRVINMRRGLLTTIGALLVVLALSSLAVSLVVAGGGYTAPAPGIPDPGPLIAWGTPALRLLTNLAAIATIGWLLAASVLDPSGKDGIVSRPGRNDLLRACAAGGTWAVLAMLQMVFTLSSVLGIDLSAAASPVVVSTYALEVPQSRALVTMTVLAMLVAVGAFATSSTGAALSWMVLAVIAASLPALAGHGAGLGDHALALTSGVAHVVAACLWIGGLFALAVHAARRDMPLERPAQRFSVIALIAFALIAISGIANAYTRLESPSQLLQTGYGQVLLAKFTLLIGLAGLAWVMRTRIISALPSWSRVASFARIAGLELTIMFVAIGLGVALASSPPPRVQTQFATLGESILGFAYPPEPTAASVAFGFRLEPFFLAASLVAASLYCIGVVRLRSRGDRWPWGRTVSWLLGIGIVIWCTNASIAQYAQVSVGLHMLQHMTLAMLAPILLVLGAPATLALRALPTAHGNERGPREWLVWLLQSWVARLLTNPVYVFVVYVIGLFGLYFTPAFGWLMGSHVGHVMMQVQFILSGYLFCWVLIGIDPRPRPLPYWGRLVLLLLALSVHGFFAVAMMMRSTPMATEWYGLVRPEWVTNPLQDSLFGGQVAWGIAEIPTLILLIIIAVQWSRSDEREAARRDRQADRDGDAELDAYNQHLGRLARGQRSSMDAP